MKLPYRTVLLMILVAISVVISVCVAAYFLATEYENEHFFRPVYVLDQGWRRVDADGTKSPVTFPYRIPDGNAAYTFEYTFHTPPELPPAPVLMLRMADMGYRLLIDGEEIARYPKEVLTRSRTTSNTIQFATLPDTFGAQTLTLVIEPWLENRVLYAVMPPQLGDMTMLVRTIVLGEVPLLLIILFGMIYSITTLVLHRVLDMGSKSESFLFICIFNLLFALYSLMTTRTLQLIVSNTYLLYLGSSLILTFIGIPAVMAFYPYLHKKYQPYAMGMVWMFLANFTGQTIVNGLRIRDLRLMLPITQWLALILLAFLLYFIYRSLAAENRELRQLTLSFFPMIAGIVVDVIRFSVGPPSDYPALSMQIGLFIFVIVQAVVMIRDYFALYRSNVRAEIYRDMAYVDLLTGLQNRNAYEEYVQQAQKQLDRGARPWCIVADLNNLKEVNDTIGHSSGDTLIRAAATLLRNAVGEDGAFFRTGGDEFVSILIEPSAGRMQSFPNRFAESVMLYNAKHNLPVQVALGIDQFDPLRDADLLALIRRVDRLMYRDKHSTERASAAKG